ncbi:hypothetical protein VTN31DRAFT_6005 [Thermomyces dupontii]|uniref:uncharacterized protein n=1 Tax=Talaromyces thermophilus TaxID=28565 RepID=UPI003743B5C9
MSINVLRILNTTLYSVLSIILLCLILLTPGDFIVQCYRTRRLTNIFIVTGAYILTALLALLLYASRIYTNRTGLNSIPKPWIPVEKGDVSKSVRRLVKQGLARSAIIAYQARPRANILNFDDDNNDNGGADVVHHDPALSIDPARPPWGKIAHPGWSAPAPSSPSSGLPGNLQFKSIVLELPHLIEAKAVSLAPPDPLFSSTHRGMMNGEQQQQQHRQAIPDPRVVDILRRPAAMGLREYLAHLTSLNLINPPELASEFVSLYERARFAARPLLEDEFRTLMAVFAEILRGMKVVDPQVLQDIRGDQGDGGDGGSSSFIGPSDEEGETDTVGNSSSSSGDSAFSGRYAASSTSASSAAAARSSRSSRRGGSERSGSVIRLATRDESSELPYVIERY